MKISKAQLRSLLARQNQIYEKERLRLAREIHDDINQKLTALSIELSLLHRRLGENPESEKVREILELTSAVNRSVRAMTNKIRPKLLDEFGIIPAIRFECQQVEKSANRKIHFSTNSEETALFSTEVRTEFFRCFQQMLAWILSGGSEEVSVEIAVFQKRFHLKVTGNFSTTQTDEDSTLELLNFQERAAYWNGKISVFQGAQTSLHLEIPLNLKRP